MSDFDTSKVDTMAAAETEDIPAAREQRKYAREHDVITVLERKIMHFKDRMVAI
jgi:hypothetical protein